MIEFLGRFHPLLVHLPIGILLIGLLLQWLSGKERHVNIKPAVPVVLLCGSITALVSCITGYLLSTCNDYNKDLVNWHMWIAVAATLTAFILYTKEINTKVEVPKKLLSVTLFILLMLTGHFGSALTRGVNYLTKPFFIKARNDSSLIKAGIDKRNRIMDY